MVLPNEESVVCKISTGSLSNRETKSGTTEATSSMTRLQSYADKLICKPMAKRTSNYTQDTPCKVKYCNGFIGCGDDDEKEIIDIEPRADIICLPVALMSLGKERPAP